MIDFAKLEQRTTANRKSGGGKGPGGQDFVWRFRRYETTRSGAKVTTSQFIISDKMWKELGLYEKGMTFAFDSENKKSYAQVVDEKKALVLRGTSSGSKNQRFKSDILEEDLIIAGILPATGLVNVKLNIEKVESTISEAYLITADDPAGQDVDEGSTSMSDDEATDPDDINWGTEEEIPGTEGIVDESMYADSQENEQIT
jgi:hypothetical protein